MPEEVNSLILNVESRSVEQSADRLDHLSRSATKAERAGRGLATSSTATNGAMGRQAAATSGAATSTAALATNQTAATRSGVAVATAQRTAGVATARAGAAAVGSATSHGALATAQAGAATATRGMTTATAGLATTLGTVLAPLLAVLTPLLALKKALGSTIEVQDFQAQLKTATGSVENAAEAFEALEDFATTTPFTLDQSLNGFIKLTNLGLTPSEQALRSYGNTASAMGKDLSQLVEAVADATTLEFERLKEFGIKAKQEGDRVSFTFRGMTTTIGKNAAEIEEYLISLGENEFDGAMVDRMNTVGGQVSNLGDSWEKLWRTVSELGVGNVISDTIQIGIDALSHLIGALESGAFEKSLESWTVAFDGWAEDFSETINFIGELLSLNTEGWAQDGSSVWETIVENAKLLPARIRQAVQRVGVEIAALGFYGVAAGKALVVALVEAFKLILDSAINFGAAILDALNPFSDQAFLESFEVGLNRQAELTEKTAKRISGAFDEAAREFETTRQARIEQIGEINAEFAATQKQVRDLTSESKRLQEEYDREAAARAAARAAPEASDRLARFRIQPQASTFTDGSGGASTGDTSSSTTTIASAADSAKEFAQLLEQLRAQENAIEGSYLRRLEIIRKNTEEGSELRAELEGKLQDEYNAEVEAFAEKTVRELDIARNGWSLQLDELNSFYERRREMILANETLTEEEKTQLITDLTRQRNEVIRGLEVTRINQGLDMASSYFANFESLANSSNKSLVKIGKAALVAQKAIAITQTIIKTQEGAISAYSAMAGIPYVGPALGAAAAAAVIAAGAANVATIASTPTNVGGFATGGIIPGSSFTGDQLTANVNSGEVILNQQQQANLLNIANRSGGGRMAGPAQVTIINQTRVPVVSEARTDSEGRTEIIIREAVDRAKQELTQELAVGGGDFGPALEANYGVRRQGA